MPGAADFGRDRSIRATLRGMCGRYTVRNPGPLLEQYGLQAFSETRITPDVGRFNIAPTQMVPVIRTHDGERELEMMKWGFQPAWMKEKGGKRPPPINARAESLLERGMWKSATTRGRCLIPADGFYEWKVLPGQKAKQPMFIRLKDNGLWMFAGLWVWDGEQPTCAIITCEPNELMETIHNRMPVILTEHGEKVWMDPEAPPDEAMTVLQPYPADLMDAYPVSKAVNSPQSQGPELIEPEGLDDSEGGKADPKKG